MIVYDPIGIIYSPFLQSKDTQFQAIAKTGFDGTVEIYPPYGAGLKHLSAFSHLILLYHFQLSNAVCVKEKNDLFLTGMNQIGHTVVRLIGIEENWLHVKDVDMMDKTPLLGIKPYVGEFDNKRVGKIGWFDEELDELLIQEEKRRFVQ